MNCDIFEEGDGELHMRYKIDPIECREINYENAFEVSVEINILGLYNKYIIRTVGIGPLIVCLIKWLVSENL